MFVYVCVWVGAGERADIPAINQLSHGTTWKKYLFGAATRQFRQIARVVTSREYINYLYIII